MILISDGKPNDYDKYEGKYGIHDVKQALLELNQRSINSYALAIEAQAKYYLPQMFGQNHYQILTTPIELLQSLVKLYEKNKTSTIMSQSITDSNLPEGHPVNTYFQENDLIHKLLKELRETNIEVEFQKFYNIFNHLQAIENVFTRKENQLFPF